MLHYHFNTILNDNLLFFIVISCTIVSINLFIILDYLLLEMMSRDKTKMATMHGGYGGDLGFSLL